MSVDALPFDAPAIEHAMQFVLDDLLNNKQPSQDTLAIIPPNFLKTQIVMPLCEAQQQEGEVGVRRAFIALCHEHSWLKELKNKPLPPRKGIENDEQAVEQKPKRRIRFVDDDVIENMPAREWLISGILPRSGVCMLFGLPGTYKSFLAIDWALSIGFGRAWLGRKTRKGGVAYIAGEGFAGLGARSRAWKTHHRQNGKSGVKWYGESLDMTDPASFIDLCEALDEDFANGSLELLVIDTFSRNSGGAEENSNTDVKKFMHTADLIQKKYDCAVLIIHHCGKNPEKGPRGASAFIGDTETIISVDHFSDAMQGIKIGCFKQKDAEQFDPIRMSLRKILYGNSPEEASIVLVETAPTDEEDDNPLASAKKSEQVMYNILCGKELTLTDWVALGIGHGISESSAKKARKELYEVRKVIGYKKEGKLYHVIEDSTNEHHSAKNEGNNE